MLEIHKRISATLKRRGLALVLLIAVVHSLIYLAVIPPWQHYDEPTHFEYAWLIANRSELPAFGDYDQGMRREVAASMIEQGFFERLDSKPNLVRDRPIWIGISQLNDPPIYYVIASLPLWVLSEIDVRTQLYILRIMSLPIYLGTIWIGHLLVKELFPNRQTLQRMIPFFIALNPAFTELMTSVNNDVVAIFVFSAFLLTGIRILIGGISFYRSISLLALIIISLYTKSTIWATVPLALFLFLLVFTNKFSLNKWFPWITILAVGLIAGLTYFSNRDAARWYRLNQSNAISLPTRVENPRSPLGDSAFRIRLHSPDDSQLVLYQPLSPGDIEKLQDRDATLGFWVWADEPIEITLPYLWLDGTTSSRVETIGTEPAFWAIDYRVHQATQRIQIVLDPGRERPLGSTSVFFDGIVLANGKFFANQPPVFDNRRGEEGRWANQRFENLAANPSAEDRWITFKPRIARLLNQTNPIDPYLIIATLQDLQTMGWVYWATLSNLFQSFWATFGWNHVRLDPIWYWLLGALSGLGILGTLVRISEGRIQRSYDWKLAVIWLSIAGVVIWLQAILRPGFPIWNNRTFIPVARYAYPALLPTMLFLGYGWHHLLDRVSEKGFDSIFLAVAFLVIAVASVITVFQFYS